MAFCRTCQSLPIRSILKLLQCDRSVDNEFQWFQLPWSVTDEKDKQPFAKWHNSLSGLQNGSSTCPFCQIIFDHLSRSYHYHTNYKDGDERGLWLQARVGDPTLTVYLGDVKPEVRLSGLFSYKTTPDSSVADCFDIHEVIEDSLHPYVLAKATAWVESCNEHHPNCLRSKQNETPLPTRLLDLNTLPGRTEFESVQGDPRALLKDTAFKLVENSPASTGLYIALSYCWGQALTFTTTRENLQKLKEDGGIGFMQLPQTLQDAIFLTRYLGIRYLWADCLCIVQGDTADWEREASRMAHVYSNSYMTIAATRARHCGEGFLHARKVKERRFVSFADAEGSFDLYVYYDDMTISPGSMGSVIDESINMRKEEPLLSRVWVLQERVLATRTIHFASYHMQWECSEQVLLENGLTEDYITYGEISLERIAQGLKSVKDTPRIRFQKQPQDSRDIWVFNPAWRVWSRLIEEYTSRNMSFQSDKLPALSGVISALQELSGDSCLAGIWKSWFLQGLLWRLQNPDWDMYVFFPKTPQKAIPWRAPTWSIASVEGIVVYTLLENDLGRETCAELLDCHVTPKGVNPLGELTKGFAKIRGPVAAVFDIAPQQSSNGRDCKVRLTSDRLAEGSVYFDVDVHDSCQVLMITPHTGVAIIPDNDVEGTYTRVGAVAVYRILHPGSEPPKHGNPTYLKRDDSLSTVDYPSRTIITLL